MAYFLAMNPSWDAQGYYDVGTELGERLSRAWDGIGTAGVNFLSAVAQALLPVSIVGLGWLAGAALLLTVPRRLPANVAARWFYPLVLFAPTFAFWTGLMSKDVICGAASLLSVRAFAQWREGRIVAWGTSVAIAVALAYLVRAYFIPVLVIPHAAAIAWDLIGRPPQELPRLRASVLVTLPLAMIVVVGGFAVALEYAGVQGGLTEVTERVLEAGDANRYGGSAVQLSSAEQALALFAPFPSRVRGLFDGLASIESVALFGLVVTLVLRMRGRWQLVDGKLLVFVLTAFALWTLLYSSVGNLGLLIRMKAQFYPFLFLGLAHLAFITQGPRQRRSKERS